MEKKSTFYFPQEEGDTEPFSIEIKVKNIYEKERKKFTKKVKKKNKK